MMQAVIFDVGGVLIRTEDSTPRRALETRLGLAPGQAEELVFSGPQGTRAQQGAITAQELWGWVQHELKLDAAELLAFRQEFFAGDRLDEGMLDLARRLRRHYQTAIISNAMDDLLETLTRRYPCADAFDLIVGSAYERVMKPAPMIFERTLARLECKPEAAVFIDDFAHNVTGARQVGMAAIHYRPGLDVAAALAALGVTV